MLTLFACWLSLFRIKRFDQAYIVFTSLSLSLWFNVDSCQLIQCVLSMILDHLLICILKNMKSMLNLSVFNYVDEIMQECPIGTYKNVSGSDRSLCVKCPSHELPHRALYIAIRGMFSLYYGYVVI